MQQVFLVLENSTRAALKIFACSFVYEMKEDKHPILRKISLETHRKCNQQLNPTELAIGITGSTEVEGEGGKLPCLSVPNFQRSKELVV